MWILSGIFQLNSIVFIHSFLAFFKCIDKEISIEALHFFVN